MSADNIQSCLFVLLRIVSIGQQAFYLFAWVVKRQRHACRRGGRCQCILYSQYGRHVLLGLPGLGFIPAPVAQTHSKHPAVSALQGVQNWQVSWLPQITNCRSYSDGDRKRQYRPARKLLQSAACSARKRSQQEVGGLFNEACSSIFLRSSSSREYAVGADVTEHTTEDPIA